MPYKPPYSVTTDMILAVAEITQLVGQIQGYKLLSSNLKLRRTNQIKSLQSNLAIEGNSLSEDQITALLEGKLVLGPQQDILEAQNALQVYQTIKQLRSLKEDDLLESHRRLMQGLIADAGRYRNAGVGVVDGSKVIHIAPPHQRVPGLMGDLFDYLVNTKEELIIKSCVFHYEFEFIHPFTDGNGRMGRLWQTVILKEKYPELQYVPFESVIRSHQQAYYQALQDSQSVGHSNPFITYMLEILRSALMDIVQQTREPETPNGRVQAFLEQPNLQEFSRNDYRMYHKDISSATASRDLDYGVRAGMLARFGEKRATTYRKV